MEAVSAYVVPLIVGLLSGVIGSWIGARSQRHLEDVRYRRERDGDLWTYQRALETVSDRMMGSHRGKPDYERLKMAEAAAIRHVGDLPPVSAVC